MTRGILGLSALVVLGATLAWAADPVAFITEIKKGRGQVQIKAAGAAEWTMPQPLLALRHGDQVRVTADARVVVLYHSGGATQTVTAANSPFTIGPPPGAGPPGQMAVVVSGVAQFLLGRQGPQTYRRAAARSLDAEEGRGPPARADHGQQRRPHHPDAPRPRLPARGAQRTGDDRLRAGTDAHRRALDLQPLHHRAPRRP